MTIEGMMCPHCTGRVEKVLGELDGVTGVTANFETGLAIVTLTEDINDDILRKTVEDQGYPVLDIK
jgi:copper chaperone CopZ